MSVFPDWHLHAVHQRRTETGCIPTGYELILRTVGAQGVDFAAFQDEFDLDCNRKPHEPFLNNFESVAAAVKAKHPEVKFRSASFPKGEGTKKLAFIEQHLRKKRPLLVSVAMVPFGGKGWHIMPVVDMDTDSLTFLKFVHANGSIELQRIDKPYLVTIHDQHDGGHEVAFLEE